MMEMEPHQESTYEPLEGQPPPRNRLESTDSPDETSPPQDRNGILYIALLAAGIGFVLPYNRYMYQVQLATATDYYINVAFNLHKNVFNN